MPMHPDQQFEQLLAQRKDEIDRLARRQSGDIPVRRVKLLSQRYGEALVDLIRATMKENALFVDKARLDLDAISPLLLDAIAEDESIEKWYELFEAP